MPSTLTTFDELVAAWSAALADLRQHVGDQEQWALPTVCTGWTIGDVVAHMVDIEQSLADVPRPDHVPDWDALPHSDSRVGRLTEVGIDLRRGTPMAEVLAEFDAIIPIRMAQLAEGTRDMKAEVTGPFGPPRELERVLRMRTLDAWVHAQDIRAAIGEPWEFDSDAALVTFDHLVTSLPMVWAKQVLPPAGSTVEVHVTGSRLTGPLQITTDSAGVGLIVQDARPDVTLTISRPDLTMRMTGRISAEDPGWLARISLTGDDDLGARFINALAIVP